MSQVSNVNAKSESRAMLDSYVAKYLLNGGTIQNCRRGERGLKPTFWAELERDFSES